MRTLNADVDTGVALISHYYAGEVLSSPRYEHSMSLERQYDENSSPKITFGQKQCTLREMLIFPS